MSLRVRRIRNISADLVVGAVLPIGASAVLAGQRALGLGVLAVTVVVIAARWAQERRRLEFRWEVLGQYVGMRALATASVAAAVVGTARRPVDVVGAVLATLVLAVLLLCEPRLKQQSEHTVPVVVNLPGVVPGHERRVSQLSLVVLHGAASAAGLVVAALGLPGLVWAALTLVPVGYSLWIVLESARRVRVTRELMTTAPAAVAAYAPEIVLHTAHAGPNYHQAMMWLPHLQATGLRLLVLTRYPGPSNALRERVGDVPLVQAPELEDLDAMMVPSVKAVFYPNAKVGNNSVIRRHPWARHVFVNHGDSDKSTAAAPSHAVYDKIFAAGPAAVRRYAEYGVLIAPEKFEVVGRPQAGGVLAAREPIEEKTSPTVLYAPTWKGFTTETSISSVSLGLRIVTAVLDAGATVVFRPHPSSYNFVKDRVHIAAIHALLAEDAQRTGRPHLFGPPADRDLDSAGCMNLADAMISDVSAVATDFLISGKPLAMVAVGADPDDFHRRFPLSRGAYLVHRDLANLPALLPTMLGPDPMRERRAEVRNDYLGDFPSEGYASHFVDAARLAGTTDKPGTRRPAPRPGANPSAGPKASSGTLAKASRPAGLRPRLGLARRALQARLKTAPAYAWCAPLLLGAGALAAGLAGSRLVTAIFVVLTVVWLARVPVQLRRPRSAFLLVGEDDVARAALVVAVVAALTHVGGLEPGVALLACGLGAALTSERLVRGWSEQWPLTRNIPGLRQGRGEVYPGVLVLLSPVVALLALAVDRPVVLGVGGVLLVLAAVAVAGMALVRIGSGKAVDAEWRAALEAYDPRFAVFVGTNVNPGDNLRVWLPQLARLDQRFVVITHHASAVEEVDRVCRAAGMRVPVVFRPKFRGLDRAITPGMNAAFYVHNSLLNNQMVSRRELTHVLLNHREAETAESSTPMAAMYDQVFVPGRVAQERFARNGVLVPQEKFRLVGRPQAGDVVRRVQPAPGSGSAGPTPTVLYAPTWFRKDATARSSLPSAPVLVEALLARGARVLFRPDPTWSRYRECREVVLAVNALLEADRTTSGRDHQVATKGAGSRRTLVEAMNASDALVTDTVAPLYDYLRSDKPFALLRGAGEATATSGAAPVAAAAYVFAPDSTDVDTLLDELLESDPLAAVRTQARVDYLGPDVDDPDAAAAFVRAACAATAARPAATALDGLDADDD